MLQYTGESVSQREGAGTCVGGFSCFAGRAPGGRSVAKILVADDNSNIQKMVGLALKDQGIDVVAVGNGEAAVRKISDVRPDLVLADVFMPVRNGYEVCKYVKDNSALSHIPVILLVGAFDPLDEQEAQRVGADGVLKKPFVPPDPLISMVKSALTRAGVSVNGADEKTEAAPPLAGADLIAPRVPPPPPPIPVRAEAPQPEEFTTRPSVVKTDSGAPVAFGSLLETPTAEEEDDSAFIAPATPAFAEERNWGSSTEKEEEEEEEEEEESPRASWRRDGEDEDSTPADDVPSAVRDWRDSMLAETMSRKSSRESWEPASEKPAVAESAKSEPVVEAREGVAANGTVASEAAPPSAPFRVTPWPSSTTTAVAAENETKSAAQDEKRDVFGKASALVSSDVAEAREASTYAAESIAGESQATAAVQPEPAREAQPAIAPSTNPWFSTAPSPWDVEAKKASRLASAWDAAPAPQTPEPQAFQALQEAPVKSEDPNATQTIIAQAEEAGLPESAVETIREEAAEVAETATQAASESIKVGDRGLEMDNIVAKVLAKMSPEVLQAVTREILKPVVEAIVRDELKK